MKNKFKKTYLFLKKFKLDRKPTLKISCSDLRQAQHLKEVANTLENWFVESDIRFKWSWKHLQYVYTFKIFKNPT